MRKLIVMLALALGLGLAGSAKADSKRLDTLSINGERLLVLRGGIRDAKVDPIIQGLVALDDGSPAPIWLVMKSPGGSVSAGFRLAAAMEDTRSPINCVVDTHAYSMAAILTQFCDKTYIQKYANMMFHQASFEIWGDESHVASRYKHTMSFLYSLHGEVAKKMNVKFSTYRKLIKNEWWLTAEGALKAGVVDGIVTGLKYEYQEPVRSSWGFFFEGAEGDIMMCGPTSDQNDPCYGIYRGRK
jgi:ATP-dependent Clp protease protease subunit